MKTKTPLSTDFLCFAAMIGLLALIAVANSHEAITGALL
jgi:hypothetical protein